MLSKMKVSRSPISRACRQFSVRAGRCVPIVPAASTASNAAPHNRTFSSNTFSTATAPSAPLLAVGLGGIALTSAAYFFINSKASKDATIQCDASAPLALKTKKFSFEEFEKMNEDGSRIVVAYQGGVYDVTDFSGHPGGVGRLQMAAGKDLSVFWKVYTQHNRGHVTNDVMSIYKIGEFKSDADMEQVTKQTYYDEEVYANDVKYPELLVNTAHPYNAEGRLSKLTDSYITPAGMHFVRNHNAVPVIDPETYQLSVLGEGLNGEKIFTLEDLKTKFPKYDVTTVIQCNGNRREDYHFQEHCPHKDQPAFGPPHWVCGAIGCATWSGCRLRDVLRECGMDVDAIALRHKDAPEKAVHVGLLGYDQDEVGNQYCCTFPFDKAVNPFGDIILAYQMNGEDIPRPYGYPVRCIVPGHAGARNCKYLAQVEITDKPCNGNSNWKQYAVHAPDVPLLKIMEFEKYKKELELDPPVQEMPVQSMITQPSCGDTLAVNKDAIMQKSIKVKGIAWGGAGSGINRVDVSADGGENFTRATLLPRGVKQERRYEWAWQFFEREIPIPEEALKKLSKGEPAQITLTSKALNGAWNVQPASPYGNVNAHGCCVNHWYQVPITLSPTAKADMKAPDGDFGNKPSGGQFKAPFQNLKPPPGYA